MRKQKGKAVQDPRRARIKTPRSGSSTKGKGARNKTSAENSDKSDRFVRDLIVRGEAAKVNRAGKLPLDATHVITKQDSDGTVKVKRVRYKAF